MKSVSPAAKSLVEELFLSGNMSEEEKNKTRVKAALWEMSQKGSFMDGLLPKSFRLGRQNFDFCVQTGKWIK